jgi:replicative superfamily II helicase
MTPNPLQNKVAQHPKGNLIISAPTGAGKTYAAFLHAAKYDGVVIWTTPLKAIASEMSKLDYLSEASLIIGDSQQQPSQGIVITTPEKAYQWVIPGKVKPQLIIIDEVHLLNSPRRGAVVEGLILACQCDMLLMSGTINPEQIQEWLSDRDFVVIC